MTDLVGRIASICEAPVPRKSPFALARLLSGQDAGAAAPAKRVEGGLTPQQKAAMQKQKMKKPVPPMPAKAKPAEAKKPCGPKLSTTDLDLLS